MRKSFIRKTKEQSMMDFQEKLKLGCNFVDYFLSIGLDPEICLNQWLYEYTLDELYSLYKDSLQPKIINKFPSFEKKYIGLDDTIIQHCFPLGYKIQEFAEKPENKTFSILLDNNNYSTNRPFKYVVCLLFYESLSDYRKIYEKYYNINPNAKKKRASVNYQRNSYSYEQNGLLNFNDNTSNCSANTNYNINAINKFLNNFSILSAKNLSDYSQRDTNISSFINNKNYYKKYYVPKCICLVSLYPFIFELRKIIQTIYKYSQIENLEIPLEKIINNLILEVPLPPRGLYSIQYEIYDQTILLKNAKLNDLFYVNFELNILFQKFNIEQILIIFQYLMLGIKIVFFSTEIEYLAPIILGCLILLFPFKFPFQVVSVLPKDSYYLIDNITPEILGVNEKYYYSFFQDNDIDLTDHLLIVDVDERNIIPCKSKSIEELPSLPKNLKEDLFKKLKDYISKIHKNAKKDKKEPIKKFEFVIRNIFLEFQIELLKDYPKYLNSNIYKHPLEKPFKMNKFLNNISSNDTAFYKKFINTQMFTDYIYKRMTPKDKIDQTEVLYFEEKIFLFKGEEDKIVYLDSKLFDINNEYKVPKVSAITDEELLNYYNNEQNHKKLLSEGVSIKIVKDKSSELKRARSMSTSTDINIRRSFNENKSIFNYIIFPKLNNDLFFKEEIKNYYLDLSIYNEIKNINSELISKSHLSRVETQTNEMTNFVYILWLKVWANTFYYHDKKEQKYRYYQMLKVFDRINQHEMSVISNLFQGLIRGNADEDLIFHLYNKILQCNLWVSNDIFNSIKNIIRKTSKNSTMPSSEIAKYLSNKGQIVLKKSDINKKLFRKRTMKNIYDMYMIKEKVTFNIEEICNNCDKKIDIYHFQKFINDTNNDILWAKCPFCKFAYLPKLKVIFGDEINKNDKLSKSTSIVDEVILYSPKILKMNFFDNSNIDVDKLKLNYNPIFWNLIWYFKINGLPFDFILPYEENIFFKIKTKTPTFFKINFSNNEIISKKFDKKIKSNSSDINFNSKLNNNIKNNNIKNNNINNNVLTNNNINNNIANNNININNINNINNNNINNNINNNNINYNNNINNQSKIYIPNKQGLNIMNNNTNNIQKNNYLFNTPVKSTCNNIVKLFSNIIKNNTILTNKNLNKYNLVNSTKKEKNTNQIFMNKVKNISPINHNQLLNSKNLSYSNINAINNNNNINNNILNNNIINNNIINNNVVNNIANKTINNNYIKYNIINNNKINNQMNNNIIINNNIINRGVNYNVMINNPKPYNIITYNNNFINFPYNNRNNNYNHIGRIYLKKNQVINTQNFMNLNYNVKTPFIPVNINYNQNINFANLNNSYQFRINNNYYLLNNKRPNVPINAQFISSYIF